MQFLEDSKAPELYQDGIKWWKIPDGCAGGCGKVANEEKLSNVHGFEEQLFSSTSETGMTEVQLRHPTVNPARVRSIGEHYRRVIATEEQ